MFFLIKNMFLLRICHRSTRMKVIILKSGCLLGVQWVVVHNFQRGTHIIIFRNGTNSYLQSQKCHENDHTPNGCRNSHYVVSVIREHPILPSCISGEKLRYIHGQRVEEISMDVLRRKYFRKCVIIKRKTRHSHKHTSHSWIKLS